MVREILKLGNPQLYEISEEITEADIDYSEPLHYEYDHLDGILATMRAVDNKSLFMKQMKRNF